MGDNKTDQVVLSRLRRGGEAERGGPGSRPQRYPRQRGNSLCEVHSDGGHRGGSSYQAGFALYGILRKVHLLPGSLGSVGSCVMRLITLVVVVVVEGDVRVDAFTYKYKTFSPAMRLPFNNSDSTEGRMDLRCIESP